MSESTGEPRDPREMSTDSEEKQRERADMEKQERGGTENRSAGEPRDPRQMPLDSEEKQRERRDLER